jgi:hypothetical protein
MLPIIPHHFTNIPNHGERETSKKMRADTSDHFRLKSVESGEMGTHPNQLVIVLLTHLNNVTILSLRPM